VSGRTLRIEEILGRPVIAKNGRHVGRVEEIRAERRGTGCVVVEYHVGTSALLERLALHAIGFGHRVRPALRVPWDQLDLTDLRRPKLLCDVAQLTRGEAPATGEGPL
jgi:sporulation protein YlmC with PRC-barrel domain